MPARATDTVHRKRSADAVVDYTPSAATVDAILRFRGGGLETVSAYVSVPPGPEGRALARSQADSLLHGIRSLAEERSLEHDARLSLREDIERIRELFESTTAGFKSETVAVFSCSRGGLLQAIGLPRAVRPRIMVDASPWVRPLVAVLAEHLRCCVAGVDRRSLRIWELYLGHVREIDQPDAANARGGAHANEHRDDRKAEELEKRHFKEAAATLDRLFATARYDIFALGGHEEELPRFAQFLPRPLRERIAGEFPLDHTNVTLGTIREQAAAILERHELERHRQAVSRLLGAEAAGGAAASGLERCLWAGSLASVQTLYVQEGAEAPGVVCDRSRWLGLSAERCPVCDEPTRHTPDVIDELVEAVIDEGGSIHHLQGETDLGDRVAVADLRFPLPPTPPRLEAKPLRRLDRRNGHPRVNGV